MNKGKPLVLRPLSKSKKKKRRERPDPKVYSINCNIPDRDMTDDHVDIVNKLIEFAEENNRRIDTIIFPMN